MVLAPADVWSLSRILTLEKTTLQPEILMHLISFSSILTSYDRKLRMCKWISPSSHLPWIEAGTQACSWTLALPVSSCHKLRVPTLPKTDLSVVFYTLIYSLQAKISSSISALGESPGRAGPLLSFSLSRAQRKSEVRIPSGGISHTCALTRFIFSLQLVILQ